MSRVSIVVIAAVAVALGAPAARASGASLIYLSWHAPYGEPGATRDIGVACGDTTREDTLFFTCDVGTDSPSFNGMTATVLVHSEVPDTLGPHWQFGRGMSRLRNIRALWDGDSALRVRTPWGGLPGTGAIHYDYTRGIGTLRMIFAVPAGQSPPVRFGDRLVLARLLVRRPPAGAGCDQPICIEWARATFALTEGYEPTVASGDRFVTWNSRAGGGCAEFRRPLGPRPWKPPPGPGSR